MTVLADKIQKLPGWARDLVRNLTQEALDWKKKALALSFEGSNVSIISGNGEVGLQPGSTVRFHVTTPSFSRKNTLPMDERGFWVDVCIDRLRPGHLLVRGSFAIAILPDVSSTIRLKEAE